MEKECMIVSVGVNRKNSRTGIRIHEARGQGNR